LYIGQQGWSEMASVVVVGAGPVGLWTAAELKLQGVDVVVVEKLEKIDPRSRAVGMQSRILDTFAMRGVLERFDGAGVKISSNHFGGASTRLDFAVLESENRHLLGIPQAKTEKILDEYVRSLGVDIRRGHTLNAVDSDTVGVTLSINSGTSEYTERAEWVVGCDGANSAVRQLVNIEFPGTPNTRSGFLADVRFENPPPGVLSKSDANGTLMMVPIGEDLWRIAGITVAELYRPKEDPVKLADMQRASREFFGSDFGMHSPLWMSRYGNATRQAAQYRKGRILLAGDAAHMFFPAGGQGVNVGIQDAQNLAWKLAAVINGWASEDLLNTYEIERRPVAQAVMKNTQAQMAVFAPETVEQLALRDYFSEALAFPEVNKMWATRIAGFDFAYSATVEEPAHAGLGRLVPDLKLTDQTVGSVYSLLKAGRFVLLDAATDSDLTALLSQWGDRLIYSRTAIDGRHADWLGFTAALIRPDGHLAWTTALQPGPERSERIRYILRQWCGERKAVV
jgi:2-polyprenyl-6-methoxyphenol hydroxylase-like FAD-dependent oxidoreductase